MNKAHRDLDKDSMILLPTPLPSVNRCNEVRNYVYKCLSFSFVLFHVAFSTDGSTRAEKGLMAWAIGKEYEITMASASQSGNVGKHWGLLMKPWTGELGFSF